MISSFYSHPRFVLLMLVVVLCLLAFLPARLGAQDASAQPTSSSPFLFEDVAKPVVFIGDDATAQRMFTTLIETYTLSRFPGWNITFRNVGWEGDKMRFTGGRAYSGDQAIRRDIEAFHPQAVLVNYGLNDAKLGDAGLDQYLVGVNVLSRDLPRVGVYRAAFISVIPEEGFQPGAPAGNSENLTLQKFEAGMKDRFPVGWQNGVDAVQQHPKGPEVPQLQNGLFIDLFNPMIGLIEAGRNAGILSPDNSLGDKAVRLMPDGVHPNWSGHLIMAALILQGLHAPDLVSSAVLDAAGRATTSAEGCTITWQDAPAGTLQFERKDDALPWPVPPDADPALKIPGFDPATTLNRYELKVTGLTAPSYKLSIDGQEIRIYTQAALAGGINLGFVRRGPLYDQGQKLLAAVIDKNDAFYNRWRTVEIGPPPAPGTAIADIRKAEAAHAEEVKPQLAQLDKLIADKEQAIHQLAQPVPHVFKLEPVTP